MPSDNAKVAQRLLDIVENIDSAVAFVSQMTLAEFVADRRTYYATLRALEIVSEAARHLPAEMIDKYSDIPWRSIRDAGNVYRHEYVRVAAETVWQTVHHALSPLRAVAVQEIGRLGYGHLVGKP